MFLYAVAAWTAVGMSLASPSRAGEIVINEIHYAPADKTVPEEFVELYNKGTVPVDLSGWSLSGGVDITIPPGTIMAPGEYLVLAQDPDALKNLYGDLPAIGSFSGRLSNDGETLVLRNAAGGREDEVDYRRGFPWPTVGGGGGYSIELVHPDLENDLGGSWRTSDPGLGESRQLIDAGEVWRYRKGTSEASSPVWAWRSVGFDESGWLSGNTIIGYGESFLSTSLPDMRNNYVSVYLRKTFEVQDLAAARSLSLEVLYDDGFNAWINGVHVADANVPSDEMSYDDAAISAIENLEFNRFRLPDPSGYLVEGPNVLTIQLHNASIGGSSDAFVDARLTSARNPGAGPTPGAVNSVFAENSAPQMRQVVHVPEEPTGRDAVAVSVTVTDPEDVSNVTLEYQLVDPGNYIRLSDPAYESDWTPVAMNDGGTGADVEAGDDVYTALLSAELQIHRRLVRYRITATDGAGLSIRAPYADDPQPNFAYFVYDGVPDWRGARRPGTTPLQHFGREVMPLLPVYHLIAVESDVIDSQYVGAFEGVHFLGTMVYEGIVYDHMEFENRGEFSTYVAGKNKWRFHFNRGHEFQARDNYGRQYRTTWQRMNFSACATPWVPTNRGMAGLGEAVAFRLYGLAGMPSPNTNYVHFRIIDEALEAHGTDQYRGDLWGLYLTLEHTDGRFLDERDLPDGNTYKIEYGNGDKRNQGPTHPIDSSDYNALKSGYGRSQPIEWWRSNVDLEGYYTFRAVNTAINNHDLREGWNICQYHNPETDRWTVIPWDLDMLYMPVTHWSGIMDFQNALTQHATLSLEYRNRARELQDLLFTPDQLEQLVDEYVASVSPPGYDLTFADLDEAMWNYHPRTSSGHRGAFYRNPSTHTARGGTINRTLVSADHHGMAQWIKDFVLRDYGAEQLESHARDTGIPHTPSVTATGDPGFPIDNLTFRCSAFSDPQGSGTFGAMKWRAAEVTPPGEPPFNPLRPNPYEINAAWESQSPTFESDITIPSGALKIGHRYRVRARTMDNTGRWSHWSPPVEFTAGEPTAPFPQQTYLRITEIMYHPFEGADYEFIELQNVGSEPLDLSPVSFVEGIEFNFADGDVQTLGPGEFVVVVENRAVFASRYGTEGIAVAGEYSGRLSNAGERIVLTCGANAAILDFTYLDDWLPLTDGPGLSMVIVDPLDLPASWGRSSNWRDSREVGGSPGADDGDGPRPGGRQRPGDANQDGNLDLSDAVVLLDHLFLGSGNALPCDGNLVNEGGNAVLLDLNGDSGVDLSDAIYTLDYLFRGGTPPALGTQCVRIQGCPHACGM